MDGTAAREVIEREWARFVELVADVAGRGAWGTPTRLAGWAVVDLVRHVHWGMTLEADALARLRSGDGVAAGRDAPEAVDALPEAVDTALRWLSAELAATEELDEGTVPMPYGAVPLALARQVFVMEAAAHTSDLEHAVTGDARFAPEATAPTGVVLTAFADALATGAPRPERGTGLLLAGPTLRLGLGFDGEHWGPLTGPASAEVRGSDRDLLLFALGRGRLDDLRLEVVGDRAVVERFKALVPGP